MAGTPGHGKYKMDYWGLNRYLNGERKLRRILRARAGLGAKVAKALAPVDTGAFRDSIHVAPNDNLVRHKRYGVIPGVRIIADSRDAAFAEFGRTKGRRPYRGSFAMATMARRLNTPKIYARGGRGR